MVRLVSALGLVAAIAAGLLALPVDVPYTVTGMGLVLPAQEWIVVRHEDGSIGTLLRDHVDGTVRSSDLHRFERGDAVRYELSSTVGWRQRVGVGDTIVRIRSNETERMLAALEGEVAAAESAVTLYASGEKEAVIRRAERSLVRAIEEVDLARKEHARLQQLAERRLVSEQELDVAASRRQVREAEVAIEQAELDAARTGAKEEQLALARSEADALRRERASVAERLDQLTIRSPIAGVAVRSLGTDTLLTVRDTSAAVVILPVPWKDAHILKSGHPVRVEIPELGLEFEGRLHQVGDTVRRLRGEQVVMATVRIDHLPDAPVFGAAARCELRAEAVRLYEYARRKVL